MKVSRRTLLIGTAAVGAVGTLPGLAAANAGSLVVFDSRIPESCAFARGRHTRLDIAGLETSRWAELRAGLGATKRVTGLTGWSDWIVARGLLEERGFRLRLEQRVEAPVSGKGHLFRWEMA
jgi:hypothetical protein